MNPDQRRPSSAPAPASARPLATALLLLADATATACLGVQRQDEIAMGRDCTRRLDSELQALLRQRPPPEEHLVRADG